MKNINLFSGRLKFLSWVLMLVTGYFIMTLSNGCKEETFEPDERTGVLSRGDGDGGNHFDLLGISCLPDSVYRACDSFPTLDTMLIMLDDYPGCSFQVVYEFYECRGDSSQYYIGNFHLISHNCSAFTTAFNATYAAGGATLAPFVENFDHDIFLKIKINLANQLVPPGTNPCSKGYVTFTSYTRVSCFKWCYYTIGHTSASKKVACGSDCCPEITTACRNDLGVLVLHVTNGSTYEPHCAGPVIYSTGGLPALCYDESACAYVCPQ